MQTINTVRTKMKWRILKSDGGQVAAKDLLPRPMGALPSKGDPFAPWYQNRPHLHYEDGKLVGIHFFGTLREARRELSDAKKGLSRLPFDQHEAQ